MLCQACGQFEANVHLTHVVEDSRKELHLCEECAAKNGIRVDAPMSLTDVLVGLGGISDTDEAGVQKKCPFCGLELSVFRKTSEIGCPVCYETFRTELSRLLSGVHKGDHHVGKVPASLGGVGGDGDPVLVGLRRELEAAVGSEDYELAARIRDRILLYRAGHGAASGGGVVQ